VTYFISDGEHVKIGVASDAERRLRSLQIGCPRRLELLLVLPGNHELGLHERFAADHARGEWFVLSAAVRAFIEKPELNHGVTDNSGIQDVRPSIWMNVRVTPSERRLIQKRAAALGLSVSEFVRRMGEAKTA
jgi:hypothetical protein